MATRRAATNKGFQDPRYRALIQILIEARRSRGLSQAAFAEKLGLHQQFVSRYELGERRLDVVEFADIARLLGLDLATLISSVPKEPISRERTLGSG